MFSSLFSKKSFKVSLALLSIIGYGVFVFAAGPFAPGTELDPACSPYINNDPLQGIDTDCGVVQAWQQNIADGFIFNLNEKIGIGTNTPTATLDVVGSFAQSQAVAGATGLGYVFMNQFSNTINSAVSTTGSSYHGLSSQLVVDYDLGATMGQGFLPPSNALNAIINNISSGDVESLLGGVIFNYT